MKLTVDKPGLQRVMRRQDGVISQRQALGFGMTRAAIRDRVEAGDWVRATHLVYRAADHQDTPRARARAAVLSLGDGAVLVGRTALWWWRLDDTEPSVFEISVPPRSRPKPRAGVRISHRTVTAEDRVVVDGVAATKKALTLLTAVASMTLLEGATTMDRALSSGAVGLAELHEVQLRTSGRWGSQRARTLLALAAGGARSEAERRAHRSLADAGIGGWSANRAVHLRAFGVAVLDIAFPEHKVLVEVDGWAYHRDLRAFLRDGPRQNALALAGWTVIRTTWYELVRDPAGFIATVEAALRGCAVATSS